ncbi:MAG: dihydrodipicolinate synthase family protein [Clostridia bacterium]|nr:dihydrodipicolinate synthase family protein [Clostridia bacterium]
MKNNVMFRGVMPALVTPVDEGGKIKRDVLKKLVDWHISEGVSGFYICGSTGEGLLLSVAQRKEMLEATLDATGGRVPVIDHIGAMNLADTVELARHAEKAGAAAISSIPPIYFAYTDDDVFNYYKKIADSTSLPMLMYGYKGARDMPISLVKKIMTLDTVIGIKWTFPDFYTMERIKQINGGNINVINGPDEMFVCGLSVGADAGIGTTYNIMPGLFVKAYNAHRANDIAHATALQHGINDVIERLFAHNVIATTKAMLEYLGFDVGQCVEPIHQLTKEEKTALWNSMNGVIDFERQDINA